MDKNLIIILIIPILMLLDYYLTVVGYKLYKKAYEKHIQFEHYELNPQFQKEIEQKTKYFSKQHLLYVILTFFSIFIIYWLHPNFMEHWAFQFILGCLISMLTMINGKHISNILIFYNTIKNPNQITGQVKFSYEHSLQTSQFNTLSNLIILLPFVIYCFNSFTIGGSFGAVIFLIITKQIWLKTYRRAQQKK